MGLFGTKGLQYTTWMLMQMPSCILHHPSTQTNHPLLTIPPPWYYPFNHYYWYYKIQLITEMTQFGIEYGINMYCILGVVSYAMLSVRTTLWILLLPVCLIRPPRIRLRPRILRDVSVSDTRTTVQGTEISFPVGIAPTAFHCLAWHEGEVATARGNAPGFMFVIEFVCMCSFFFYCFQSKVI